MMVGKMAVHVRMKKSMVSGHPGGERRDDGASRTVAGIPADAQAFQRSLVDPVERAEQAIDIGIDDAVALRLGFDNAAVAAGKGALIGDAPQIDYAGTEERRPFKYHLEAIVIGGIVAAGYVNAALNLWG